MAEYFTKDGDDFKAVEEKLLPESTVNGIVEKRLEQQRRNQFGDYDALKEKADKYDNDVQELKGQVETATKEKSEVEKQLSSAKLETDRVKIVHEFKLSDELAEFVTGDSAEDMRKRAEKLANGVKTGNIKIDKKSKPEDQETDSKKLAKGLFGGKKSDD
jgi:hypothetical protein